MVESNMIEFDESDWIADNHKARIAGRLEGTDLIYITRLYSPKHKTGAIDNVYFLDKVNIKTGDIERVIPSFPATMSSMDLSFKAISFKREGLYRIIIRNGVVENIFLDFKVEKMEKVKKNFYLPEKFGVLDLETYLEDEKHIVYAGGYKFTGEEVQNFYKEEGMSSSELLSNLFMNMLIKLHNPNSKARQVKSYYVYAHNMSKFDGPLIIAQLLNEGFSVKTIFKNPTTILQI
jgi:hypothetical protein